MIQEIVTYLIVTAASVSFAYKMLSFFNVTGKKRAKTGNCSGCGGSCELHQAIPLKNGNLRKRDKYQFYL